MDSSSLQDLEDHFLCKLQGLATCMDISAYAADPSNSESCKKSLFLINKEVGEMEGILAEMKQWVNTQKELLKNAESSKEELAEMISSIHHMRTNLPKHLPKSTFNAEEEDKENHRLPLQEKQLCEDTYVVPKNLAPHIPLLPCMDYLTKDEFEKVPKYLKGRLTYEHVNSLVEAINEVLEKKYTLLSKSKKSLSEKRFKEFMKYKEQENKDSKGFHFFTDEDLRKHGTLKYDTTIKSRLTILRHCIRLKEIRGGGITRFALLY